MFHMDFRQSLNFIMHSFVDIASTFYFIFGIYPIVVFGTFVLNAIYGQSLVSAISLNAMARVWWCVAAVKPSNALCVCRFHNRLISVCIDG